MKPVRDWEKHKLVIAHLYQNENKPLRDVMKMMARSHGFLASPKQYKDQLKKWDMVKNLNEKDVALCLYALEDPQREQQKYDVLLRNRVMTRADINTYLKKTKRTEENLRAAVERPTTWPKQITLRASQRHVEAPSTPHSHYGTGQELSPSQLTELGSLSWTTTPSGNVSSRSSKVLTPLSSVSQRTSFSSLNVALSDIANVAEQDSVMIDHVHHTAPHTAPHTEGSMGDIDMCEDDEVSEGDMAQICAGLASSDEFGAMVWQAAAPKPLAKGDNSDPLFLFFRLLSSTAPALLQRGQHPSAAMDVLTSESRSISAIGEGSETFVRTKSALRTTPGGHESASSVDMSVSFLRECLSACIVQGQGFRETAKELMHGAVDVFRSMIIRSDPYCLTALNLLVALFESVGQRPLAEIVLRSILENANEIVREGPIEVTIRFMLDIVGEKARQSQYDVHRLRKVYRDLCDLYGMDSPSALVGLYHVAWSLALERSTRRDAWEILEELNKKCEVTLGLGHFQTITSMATSARVLCHLGEHWHAARMINQAISRLGLMYEDSHPFRLEARARQAKLLLKLEGSHDVETILQDVVRRQAAILGVHNSRTESTLKALQNFLIDQRRTDEANSLPKLLESISRRGSLSQ